MPQVTAPSARRWALGIRRSGGNRRALGKRAVSRLAGCGRRVGKYTYLAKLFARHGFVALAYDERGTGDSQGRLYDADHRDFADDALAAARFLARSFDVDERCVGLVGFSES